MEPAPLRLVVDGQEVPWDLREAISPGLLHVEKMRYDRVLQDGKRQDDKTSIVYNEHVTISGIPIQAQDYLLGSRSGLDWLLDRYRVSTHKASGIVNDPNDWMAEGAGGGPTASAQPFSDQAPVESSPFGQMPFDTSNEAGSWTEQAPQVDSPYQAASAPEAAGPQGSYAPGLSAGSDGFSQSQQDVGSYANYAAGQQEQAGPAAPQQQDDTGEAWRSPLQWNDVIGGGHQGTGPRQDV